MLEDLLMQCHSTDKLLSKDLALESAETKASLTLAQRQAKRVREKVVKQYSEELREICPVTKVTNTIPDDYTGFGADYTAFFKPMASLLLRGQKTWGPVTINGYTAILSGYKPLLESLDLIDGPDFRWNVHMCFNSLEDGAKYLADFFYTHSGGKMYQAFISKAMAERGLELGIASKEMFYVFGSPTASGAIDLQEEEQNDVKPETDTETQETKTLKTKAKKATK